MSISKLWTSKPSNISQVLKLYRQDNPILIIKDIAKLLNTTEHNIQAVIKNNMSPEEHKLQKTVRYSQGKMGDKNPMKGKTGEQHHNYIGDCSDHKGYFTRLYKGKRIFTHHAVILEALGIDKIPDQFVVHHIDDDPSNNSLDNLALCTRKGHMTIHSLQKISQLEKSRRLTIAELRKFGT
jgi:hypothetical protein